MIAPVLLGLIASLSAASQEQNRAILGVVAVKGGKNVEIARVLKGSPAAAAGLKKGDWILKIAGSKVGGPRDVDRLLGDHEGGAKVAIEISREGKSRTVQAKLADRKTYRGEFPKTRARGEKGFKAPEWISYAWTNLGKGKPPTRESAKGKVVVFHAFQSW